MLFLYMSVLKLAAQSVIGCIGSALFVMEARLCLFLLLKW